MWPSSQHRSVSRHRAVSAFKPALLVVAVLNCLPHGAGQLFAVGEEPPRYPHGAVAADHPLASQAGVEILRQGGNVIDAAVATAFALSVLRPESSGMGGGGFLLHWDAEQQTSIAWDYRERAPLAATADMYSAAEKAGIAEPSVHGMLAVAVPGQIPGLCEIHRRAGRLPLRTVLAPALKLATDGVPVDRFARSTQRSLLQRFTRDESLRITYAPLWELYLNSGKAWADGDRFYSPQRKALELLTEQGPAAFADGPIGDALLKLNDRLHGRLSRADLQQMQPVARQPLQGEYGDYQLLTMPPPSSGGIAILETLQILKEWSQQEGHPQWNTLPDGERQHVLIEALKHAFADRAEFLADTDFVAVPVQRLLSREHAIQLARKIRRDQTLSPDAYGRFQLPDDAGTTHFCVMDADGNAVACTETINTTFGSYVVDPVTGIVLNNEMDDFTAIPGQTNAFGLKQSDANLVAPRKKPLSSMSPTIVLKDGRAVAIAGASGGPRIITATLQVLLAMLQFDQSATAAVSAARLHHQWQPDQVLLEPGLKAMTPLLSAKGHRVQPAAGLAATQAVRRTAAGIEPASDPRKSGQPAGY